MELERVPFSVREALDYGLSMMRERAARHGLGSPRRRATSTSSWPTSCGSSRSCSISSATPSSSPPTVARSSSRRGSKGTSWRSPSPTPASVSPRGRERIFESFQQGPRSSSTQEGTGLGLTLCRRIVGLMGGRMWLDSEVGVGSTFGFTVPLGTAAAADRARPRCSRDPDRPRCSSSRTTTVGRPADRVPRERRLRGHECARRSERAGRDRPAEPPVAVVLDIRLPHLDGWEVLTR